MGWGFRGREAGKQEREDLVLVAVFWQLQRCRLKIHECEKPQQEKSHIEEWLWSWDGRMGRTMGQKAEGSNGSWKGEQSFGSQTKIITEPRGIVPQDFVLRSTPALLIPLLVGTPWPLEWMFIERQCHYKTRKGSQEWNQGQDGWEGRQKGQRQRSSRPENLKKAWNVRDLTLGMLGSGSWLSKPTGKVNVLICIRNYREYSIMKMD